MNSLCKICGLFVSKANFARHVETHGQNKHRCEICNKTFTTKNYLTEHKRTHREPEEYSCDKCLKVFGSKSNPRGHIKTKHESTSSYSCEYCSKKFERAFSLKRHTDSCQNYSQSYSQRGIWPENCLNWVSSCHYLLGEGLVL